MNRNYWLRNGDSTISGWALFQPQPSTMVKVLAVIGATGLIDRFMLPTEARELWRKLRGEGWHRALTPEVKEANMDPYRLRLLAYD